MSSEKIPYRTIYINNLAHPLVLCHLEKSGIFMGTTNVSNEKCRNDSHPKLYNLFILLPSEIKFDT